MKTPSFESMLELAARIATIPDDRPSWLKSLCQIDNANWLYYRFFYELTKTWAPFKLVEVGTYHGGGAGHFAHLNRQGLVVTIDFDPTSALHVRACPLDNVVTITSSSLDAAVLAETYGPFDGCFIDAEHDLASMYQEYALYRKLVRDGGLMFFDDVNLNPGMQKAWSLVRDPKTTLPGLHFSGFGVARKNDNVVIPEWLHLDAATRSS